MKHWWIWLLGSGMFAGAQEATAQEGGWMVHLGPMHEVPWHPNAFGGTGRSIRETESGYLVFGEMACPYHFVDGYPLTHVFVWRLDHEGNYLDSLHFGREDMNNYIGNIDPVADHPDGGFVACDNNWPWAGEQVFQICSYNEQGDTTWCKKFLRLSPEDSIRISIRDMALASDGGYILGGWREDGGPPHRAFLVRVGNEGDTLWTRTYSPGGSMIYNVEPHPLGGYVASGPCLGLSIDRISVFRVGENGEELWRRNMGFRSPNGNIGMVCEADGSVVTWCTYSSVFINENPKWKMITKWDANGEMVWQKLSSFGTSNCFDLAAVPGGGYIGSGTYNSIGSLDRFNAQGDSLWSRSYWWFWNWNLLYDVEPTSDGGFIATGRGEQSNDDPNPGLYTVVILKTDSLGCVIPGCHTVGVQEYAVDLDAQLRVWPNPVARGMPLHVAFDVPEGFSTEGKLRVVLQDALGREVLAEQWGTQLQTAQLQTGKLSPGMYYLHLADDRRWLAGRKIIVE